MSVQEHLAPYLNRVVILLHQNASANLNIFCRNGKVTINIFQDLGDIPLQSKSVHPIYPKVMKKNIKPSQLNRLQRRATTRTEEAIQATRYQQQVAENAKKELEEAKLVAEKSSMEAEQAKAETEQSKAKLDQMKLQAEKVNTDKSAQELTCKRCDLTFETALKHHHHIMINHENGYDCSTCGTICKSLNHLKYHWNESCGDRYCEFCKLDAPTCHL